MFGRDSIAPMTEFAHIKTFAHWKYKESEIMSKSLDKPMYLAPVSAVDVRAMEQKFAVWCENDLMSATDADSWKYIFGMQIDMQKSSCITCSKLLLKLHSLNSKKHFRSGDVKVCLCVCIRQSDTIEEF